MHLPAALPPPPLPPLCGQAEGSNPQLFILAGLNKQLVSLFRHMICASNFLVSFKMMIVSFDSVFFTRESDLSHAPSSLRLLRRQRWLLRITWQSHLLPPPQSAVLKGAGSGMTMGAVFKKARPPLREPFAPGFWERWNPSAHLFIIYI